jgi:hypothetical protein
MKKKNLLLTAVATIGLAAATLAQTVPNYVPTNGLVGWWPFNGNANDESGNNNNGTVNGASLTTDRFGNNNRAYDFNGSSDITIPHNNALNFQINNKISVSIWVKTNTNQLYRSVMVQKISGVGNTQSGYDIALDNGGVISQRVSASLSLKNGSSGSWGYASDSTANFITNSWHNLIFVYDQNIGKCYVDGVLKNTIVGQSGVIGNNTNSLLFGSTINQGLTSKKFIGQLDDIGIWNRALTQQEITDLYNANICYQTITVTDTLIINTNLVGFNPVTYQNSIKIFPNPTNDHVTIDYGNYATLSGYQLKIENSLGQQVFQTTINQQSSYLNLSNWGGNGIYFVRLIDPQGNTIDIRKIVLQ